MKSYVLGFMFDTVSETVSLMLKQRPKWQKGLLNGIGGKIEAKESPIQAMVREFEEETAVKVLSHNWKHVITLKSKQFNSIVFIFKTEGDISLLKKATDEEIQVVDYTNLGQILVPNLKWMIPLMLADLEFPVVIIENKVVG